jgi:hypothetical protein
MTRANVFQRKNGTKTRAFRPGKLQFSCHFPRGEPPMFLSWQWIILIGLAILGAVITIHYQRKAEAIGQSLSAEDRATFLLPDLKGAKP